MAKAKVEPENSSREQPERATRPRRRGAGPWTLVGIYLTLILAPLGLALFHYPIESRPWIDQFASILGIVAFGALLVEFLFSGRHRWISGRIGVERTMNIHRQVAYVIIAFIVIHPFLYSAPDGASWPWFNAADPTLRLSHWSLFSGLAAWILTAVIILVALDRNQLSFSYETWRVLHAASAIVLGALISLHAITAGGYSAQTPLLIYWLLMLIAAALILIQMFLVRPWRQRHAPYIVQAIDQVGDRTWQLELQPEQTHFKHATMRFRPGQFAWLKFGRKAFQMREHPFSISTSSKDASSIGFLIKEKGDFTDHISEILPGSRVFLDGPHGHLLPDEGGEPAVYIAGGTGISPVLSHLRTFRSEKETGRKLTLIYSVSTDTQITEQQELTDLAEALDLTVHYVVQHPTAHWRGATGVFDREKLDQLIPRADRDGQRYFICGPPRMVRAVRRALRELEIPGNRIVTGS